MQTLVVQPLAGDVGLLEKTEAGRRALATRTGALGQRHRALLIMIDGRTAAPALLARAAQLRLAPGALDELLAAGLVRPHARNDADAPVEREEREFGVVHLDAVARDPVADDGLDPRRAVGAPTRRSLAKARVYLMDVMVRSFRTADHPLRLALVEARDPEAVGRVFDAFVAVLREEANPTMVATIEREFRQAMPEAQG